MTIDYVELEALMYDHHFVLLLVAFMRYTQDFDIAYEKAKHAMAKLRAASD